MAQRTTLAPTTNEAVIGKWNRPALARKERTIERLVAKPFMMLSAYLITSAVMRPPKTCVRTVAHAHGVKSAKMCEIQGTLWTGASGEDAGERMIGTRAGSRENKESWTLRTQRSPEVFLSTISK